MFLRLRDSEVQRIDDCKILLESVQEGIQKAKLSPYSVLDALNYLIKHEVDQPQSRKKKKVILRTCLLS